MIRRLKSFSDWLDDSLTGDALGAIALFLMLIAGLFVAYGVLG